MIFDSLSETDLASMQDRLLVLASLRAASVRFANAYAPSPESGPARASLFTGLDMAAHGVWTDGVALPGRETTLPERLAECGYRTWLVRRRHLAGVSHWATEHARPFEFDHFDWSHGPLHRSRQNAYLTWLQDKAPEIYFRIFPHQPDPDDTGIPAAQRSVVAELPDDLGFNTWVGTRVCELLLQGSSAQPFLGIAGPVIGETMGAALHHETPCERLQDHALHQADAALGEILNCLDRQGLAENTALVVASARGTGAEAGDGMFMRESAIRVPLLLRSPHHAARIIEPAVSTIDIAPSLYALAQVSAPRRTQGTDLLAAAAGGATRGWALSRLRNPDQEWMTSLCDGRWKLVMSHGDLDAAMAPDFRLYDLHADPNETRDLATPEEYQDRLEQMFDRMIDARVAGEDRTEPRIAKF